ncbi:type II toxin-antitoxin system MqsR family toxin [Cupriavidus sp. DF5525]|uniref:type II toxin-antitoxin system MqsR family toxin n=1 Tax=Cupriavidus sp. DF5525 TaxID=3160989 RepID=UPI0035A960BE
MEKGTAHYSLWRVRELLAARRVTVTRTARDGAVALGLDMAGLAEVIGALRPAHLRRPHRLAGRLPSGYAYLKLTVTEGLLVVSFKAR